MNRKHILSQDCWCEPRIEVVPNKLEVALADYTKGVISLEKLSEIIGVNFYTLYSAFLKFCKERLGK